MKKPAMVQTGLIAALALSVYLTPALCSAEMKRLGQGDGVRVIRQLDMNQKFGQSTFKSEASPAAQPASSTPAVSSGAKSVSVNTPTKFDTKRLDQGGARKVYRNLDKTKTFEISTYKPKIHQAPENTTTFSIPKSQQPIFRNQPISYRTHRAGVFDDGDPIVHRAGQFDQSRIITHGPGRDGQRIINHGPGRDGRRIITHGPGRDGGRIVTHRAGKFGYK